MTRSNKILIVEDNEENVIFISEILEEHGYQFQVVNTGEEALTSIQKMQPDLILLDIMMPRKDGISVYKELKKDPELEKIPIIIITGASLDTGVDLKTGKKKTMNSSADKNHKQIYGEWFGVRIHEKLQNITPDGFIEKPIDPLILIKKIKELLTEKT